MAQIVLASSKRKAQQSVIGTVFVGSCFIMSLAYYATPTAQLTVRTYLAAVAIFLLITIPPIVAVICLQLSRYVQVVWEGHHLLFRKPLAFGSSQQVNLEGLTHVTLKKFKGAYFQLEYSTGQVFRITVDFLTPESLTYFSLFLQTQAVAVTDF